MAPNKGVEKWRWVVYFDSESTLAPTETTIVHTPRLICATFLDRERGIRNEQDFEGAHLCEDFYTTLADIYPHTTCYVIAHNVGYDLLATRGIRLLSELGWHVDSLYEKGFTYILRVRGDEGRQLVFLSSTQFWNNRLADVAPLFGMEKLGTEHQTHDFEELRRYCRQDTLIVERMMEWLQGFVADNDLGGMAMTLPSLAMKAFRHRFMPIPPVIHNYAPALILERASYHGGRNEAWWLGKVPGTVFKLDVNAMYPAVMRDRPHPYRLARLYPEGSVELLLRYMGTHFLIADVTPKVTSPVVPLREDKLLFPIGTFPTILCSPELRLLDPDQLQAVRSVAVYDQGPLFREYVSFFYEERIKAKRAGERPREELLKKYQNTLYGKFGQRGTEWVRLGSAPPDEVRSEDFKLPNGDTIKLRTFGGTTWINDGAVMESFDSFPAIASSVTSCARALLWRYIETAGQDNVYYMDTDSLFVNRAGYDRLLEHGDVDAERLGALKLEKVSDDVEIFGAKDYRFGNETRHKGIPIDAERVGDKAKVWMWPKVATFIRDHQLEHFENRAVLKTLKTEYTKGTRTLSGRVDPLVRNVPAGHVPEEHVP